MLAATPAHFIRIILTRSFLHDFLLLMRSGLALRGQVQHVAHIGGGSHVESGGSTSSAARVQNADSIPDKFAAKKEQKSRKGE